MTIRRCRYGLLLSAFCFAAETAYCGGPGLRGQKCEVGVLEDWCMQLGTGRNEIETTYSPRVRMAFEINNGKWTAHPSGGIRVAHLEYAGRNEWHSVELPGAAGVLVSTGVERYSWYADIGTQKIISALPSGWAALPRTREYSGELSCPVKKPWILATCPVNNAASDWSKVPPAGSVDAEAVAYIAEKGPDLYTCEDIKDSAAETTKAKISPDMMRTEEAWRAKDGRTLFALQFSSSACIMNVYGGDESLFWFIRDAKGHLSFLERGMSLLNVADYDVDGAAELIFWMDAHNMNGYYVLPSGANKGVAFTWNYH